MSMQDVPDKIIFLTGIGRSGTTLLQSILSAHTEVHFPAETHFFKRYILPFIRNSKIPTLKEIESDLFLKRLSIKKQLELSRMELTDLEGLKKFFIKIMQGDGKCWGDKDTEYVRYIEHLRFVFPEAYLIHIIRDPRDVVSSRMKTAWGRKRSLAFHAGEYQHYIRKVTYQGPRFFNERYIEIKYEDLISTPESTLDKVCGKLQIEYQANMLDFQREGERLVSDSEKSWKQNLAKPLLTNNTEKWKTCLTNDQIATVEQGIEELMEKYGYEPVGGNPRLIDILVKASVNILFNLKSRREKLS